MKTAISISDDVFLEAEQVAHQMVLSRSKLYSMAILEFVQNHNPDTITARLNKVYDQYDSRLDDDINQLNNYLLSQEDW